MSGSARTTGKVKWFSRVKGYGFITPDGDEMSKDVFVPTRSEFERYRTVKASLSRKIAEQGKKIYG